jgi:hypothetical protein
MNTRDARRSVYTLSRFQIIAEALEKVDRQGKAKADSAVVKVTNMWGHELAEPVILKTEDQAFDFYAENVISNEAFAPPPFVSFATKKDLKNVFKKLTQWEQQARREKPPQEPEADDQPPPADPTP